MHTKQELETYFRAEWTPRTDIYKWSGWRLTSIVPPNVKVLDVGCGYNLFKPFFGDRLLGIDPYNKAADLEVSLEDFDVSHPDVPFEVIFCLGSINFGTEDVIRNQVQKLALLSKPGTKIYWRQNPGKQDHNNEECKKIHFFEWSFEKNTQLASQAGFMVNMLTWDSGRIYSEWTKL